MNGLLKCAVDPEKAFQYHKGRLSEEGVSVFSPHERVGIPKDDLSEEDLEEVGFKPTLLATPEPGQRRLTSFRHPDRYHAHDHGESWIMHRDRHNPGPASTLEEKLRHVTDEGLPCRGIDEGSCEEGE